MFSKVVCCYCFKCDCRWESINLFTMYLQSFLKWWKNKISSRIGRSNDTISKALVTKLLHMITQVPKEWIFHPWSISIKKSTTIEESWKHCSKRKNCFFCHKVFKSCLLQMCLEVEKGLMILQIVNNSERISKVIKNVILLHGCWQKCFIPLAYYTSDQGPILKSNNARFQFKVPIETRVPNCHKIPSSGRNNLKCLIWFLSHFCFIQRP